MLVLSRREGESVMVGDYFRVTVAAIAAERAMIVVARKGLGYPSEVDEVILRRWMRRDEREIIPLAEGASVTLADIRGEKVRLGFTLPRGMSLHREEVYDALHDRKTRQKENDEKADYYWRRSLRDQKMAWKHGIALALEHKFGEAAKELILEIWQIYDVEILKRVDASIEIAATIDDIRRVWR